MNSAFFLAAMMELVVAGSWTALPGNGRIRTTSDYLRFSPREGLGLGCVLHVRKEVALNVFGSQAEMPLTIRSKDGRVGRAGIRPMSATLLVGADSERRFASFAGAGVFLPLVRRGRIGTMRLDTPDHAALMLQGGVRFRVDQRFSIISDVRYGPAPSTIEVFSLQQQGEGMQANYHPLIVSTGLAIRF